MTAAVTLLTWLAVVGDPREARVGVPSRIEALVLPGPELVVAPAQANCPIVLRITATYPHGSALRYDLEYSGLEAGEFDLKGYLQHRDGTPPDDAVPPLKVRIRTELPPGQVRPHPVSVGRVPRFGGYRWLLMIGGVVWVAGLVAFWRARRQREASVKSAARPLTLADRLKPLVEGALQGTLSREARAQLELVLVAYWRRKLDLDDRRPGEVLGLLRAHAEAGPLLKSLEDWLHRPAAEAHVDLNVLLAPYAFLPADAIDDAWPLDAPALRAGSSRTESTTESTWKS